MPINESESGHLTIGTTEVPFTIYRSYRRKHTVALVMEPNQGLLVRAPIATSLEELKQIARKRAPWIIQQMADHRCLINETDSREYVSGTKIAYLGRNYRLKVMFGGEARCRLWGGWLEVTRVTNQSDVLDIVIGWYVRQALTKCGERLAILSKRHRLPYTTLFISAPKTRWGSCDASNNIRINWRIMMAPMTLVDYVLMHELCHTVYKDHSPAFWDLLGSLMPDYEDRKSRLRLLGPSLSL